jgi:hypothetical protein
LENKISNLEKKSARHYSLELEYTYYKHYHRHSHISHDLYQGKVILSKGAKKTFIPMKYPDFRNVEAFAKTLIPQIKEYQEKMESMFKSGVNPHNNILFEREDADYEWVLKEHSRAEYLDLVYVQKGARLRNFIHQIHPHITFRVRDTKNRTTQALSLFEHLAAELGYRSLR